MTEYLPGIYFLTGSTFLHFPYFRDEEQKEIIYNQIKKIKKELGIKICAFSIQINHYHILFETNNVRDVEMIKKYIHGGVSRIYRQKYRMKYKEMWGSMKTIKVFSLEMYWKIIGYIAGNLLKHKEVGTFEELFLDSFSCYSHFVGKYGEEMMREIIYSVLITDEDENGLVDAEEMKKVRLGRVPN